MAVHDGVDIGPGLVDRAVNVAFEVGGRGVRIDHVRIQRAFDDVLAGHGRRGDGAGDEIAVRIAWMAERDMAETVEHALVGEDQIGGDQIVDEGRVHLAA